MLRFRLSVYSLAPTISKSIILFIFYFFSRANCCNDCHRTDCLRYLGLICCCCSLVIDLISGSD
uniref:Uncharacterized protein n=1 Tax=Meloidogyne enterolobii TaxID=390850 RepID=A0A6V7UCX0_MELEN|nr:unnamed protein product [Meloidogyne enterolobii]